MSEWANVQTVSDVDCQAASNEQTLSAVTVSRANKKTWLVFAKLRKATISSDIYIYIYICLCVCDSLQLHGTTRLPIDGFSLNLMFENFFEKI
jgi:hypothetical protein